MPAVADLDRALVRRLGAAPIHIGIGSTGCGSIVISRDLGRDVFGAEGDGSWLHTARIIAIPSSMRRPRSWNGTPRAANSASSQPTPTPRISRPSEKLCKVDNSLASGSGWRIGSTSTLVPSRTRLVTAATQVKRQHRVVEQRRTRKLRARHDDVLADPDIAEPQRLGADRAWRLISAGCRLAAGMRQMDTDLHRFSPVSARRRPWARQSGIVPAIVGYPQAPRTGSRPLSQGRSIVGRPKK